MRPTLSALDPTVPSTSARLYAVLYRSVAAPDLRDDDLSGILRASMQHNARERITGLLLYSGAAAPATPARLFVQWLEGPREAVRRVYDRICGDHRHVDCEVLAEGWSADLLGQDARLFPYWSMSFDAPGALPTTPGGIQAYARTHTGAYGAAHPLRAQTLGAPQLAEAG